MKISQTPSRRRRITSAVISASLLASGLALGVAPAAHAAGVAEAGVGFGSLNGTGNQYPNDDEGWLGSIYIPGVGYTFCVNPALNTGYNADPVEQSSYNRTYVSDSGWDEVSGRTYTADLTPREMFEVSYIIATYGQLDAPRTGYSLDQAEWAAAVEMSVWDRAIPQMQTDSWTQAPSQLYKSRAGSSESAVLAKLAAINADVANQVPSSSTGASGTLDVVMTNYRDGKLVVNLAGTPSASVVLTLSGAVFSATGESTMTVEASNGLEIPITGLYEQPKDSSGITYNITATGTATVAGSGYGENARVLSSSGQDTITVGSAPPTTFTLNAGTEDPIILFDAVVTTEAPTFIGEGETFTDTLFATIGNPSDPASSPWPQWDDDDGSYYDVEVRGTLYGPFLALPDESATAPSWAPVAASDVPVTLTGPGTYQADAGVGALEPGFYTWVWEVDAADQSIFTRAVLPENYHFVDDFAQRSESTISASSIVATSEVVEAEVAVTDRVQDTITVGSQGGWIQEDGARVPVVFDGTAYFVPGDVAPELSDTVPAGTEVIGTTQITATAPGVYTSEELTAPVREGFVVWVWEINEASQPAYNGYVKDWNDQFGIPSETTRVLAPIVATQAQTDVPVGDPIWDTAVVTGRVPTAGVDLSFELYEATKDENDNWVCEAGGNLLWTSSSQRVTAEGTYQSPNAPAQPEGTYHWVEVITTPGGEEISRGECGIPNETTEVIVPEVTTNAQPGANLGGELFDIATVTGPIAESGYDLTFQAYKVPVVKDETGAWVTDYPEGFVPSEEEGANNLTWVCEVADPVFTTEESILVTEAGDFTSESFTPEEFGKYLWVETLTWNGENGESIEIHRGECGIAEESGVILDVTTKAQTDNGDQTVDLGEMAWDKAILNGYVPEGSTVTIVGHQTSSSTPVTEACTAETQVYEWTSEPLLGGMAENLEVDSDKFSPEHIRADETLYFVEVTRDALGRTVSEGECGEPSETLTVEPGEGIIAWTGGSDAPALWVGGAALMALIAGAGVYMIRRREVV